MYFGRTRGGILTVRNVAWGNEVNLRAVFSDIRRQRQNNLCKRTMTSFPFAVSRQTFLSLRRRRQLPTCRFKSFRIPDPTWSVEDLDLTSNRPRLPPEELKRLSRLALIDIDSIPDKEGLEQDLANMLHMIDQVSTFEYKDEKEADKDEDENDIDKAAEIYDIVRGVTSAPLRKSLEDDPLQTEDQEQAENVWKSLLQPKTTRKGGRHEYFAIKTKDR